MSFARGNGFSENLRPRWCGDVLDRQHLLPGGVKLDASTFIAADAIPVIVGAAGAAINATSVPVDALVGVEQPFGNPLIPSGSILNFGPSTAVTVTTGAAAAKGATSITVTALSGAIPSGTVLDFGTRTAVVVTVGSAGALANATSVPVAALTGPIPVGAILDFGTKKFAEVTAAAALGAETITVEALPTALVENDAATYEAIASLPAKLSAPAAAAATALTVVALDERIVSGSTATFAGSANRVAVTTQDANIGDTHVHVSALADALVNDDAAHFIPANVRNRWNNGESRRVAAGTPVKMVVSELEAGAATGATWKYAGNGVTCAGTDIVRLLAFDVQDVLDINDGDIIRPGTLIYSNRLAEWAACDATVKTALRATYDVTVGGVGQEVASS